MLSVTVKLDHASECRRALYITLFHQFELLFLIPMQLKSSGWADKSANMPVPKGQFTFPVKTENILN